MQHPWIWTSSTPVIEAAVHQHRNTKQEVFAEVLQRLADEGYQEVGEPGFADELRAHFARLPTRKDRAQVVLIHKKMLEEAENPKNLPVVNVRSVYDIAITAWNLTSDPCSGKWQGVNCCLKQELDSNPCCTAIYKDPTKSSCTVSSVNSTIVGVNLDSNYNGGRMLTEFLPDSICNLTSLVTLDLNNNFLSGQIPRCIFITISVNSFRVVEDF